MRHPETFNTRPSTNIATTGSITTAEKIRKPKKRQPTPSTAPSLTQRSIKAMKKKNCQEALRGMGLSPNVSIDDRLTSALFPTPHPFCHQLSPKPAFWPNGCKFLALVPCPSPGQPFASSLVSSSRPPVFTPSPTQDGVAPPAELIPDEEVHANSLCVPLIPHASRLPVLHPLHIPVCFHSRGSRRQVVASHLIWDAPRCFFSPSPNVILSSFDCFILTSFVSFRLVLEGKVNPRRACWGSCPKRLVLYFDSCVHLLVNPRLVTCSFLQSSGVFTPSATQDGVAPLADLIPDEEVSSFDCFIPISFVSFA